MHGRSCKLLVDTGAQVSILSKSLWQDLEPRGKLVPYRGGVRAANGNLLGILGTWKRVMRVP